MSNNNDFEFCASLKWETDGDGGAYLFTDGANDFWIPKSLVREMDCISGDDYNVTIPEWVAIDKEII